MKKLKRVFSFMMALVMLASTLNLEVLHVQAASNEPTSGSTEVPKEPENYLSAGEWLYWVDENQAYIAGYTNKEAVELTIPGKLGGRPVVGIGSRAFCDNQALQTISIHTNVIFIAGDAFEGLNACYNTRALPHIPELTQVDVGFVAYFVNIILLS